MLRLVWRALAIGSALAALVAACTSDTSPYQSGAECTLSEGVWSCGTGYGSFPDCAATSGPCSEPADAGPCFTCPTEAAGETCGCERNDAGQRVWQCIPAGTGCTSS